MLTERLVTYDTSSVDGLRSAAGFVKGWLDARSIAVADHSFGELYVLTAEVGPAGAPTLLFHGHLDVVPGRPEQFAPRVEGDRLYGRGAYDMKGGLAAMMLAMNDLAAQDEVRVQLLCVPDEESEDIERRTSDEMVRRGLTGDFAITGEPTNLRVGVQAKGVLSCRVAVHGRAAHSSTPWLGDNAVLKAIDVFRRIESLPFSRESSELFDRPSINLGRIVGGDAVNKVPDECVMDVDIRYLPNQDPDDLLGQIRTIDDMEIRRTFVFPPAYVSRSNPYVLGLAETVTESTQQTDSVTVGRDGASDAVSFLKTGIPAVEFGPAGAGHHGPEEWVSIPSLREYREMLVRFARAMPGMQTRPPARERRLEALEGGQAA
ncbi:MAG: succinyl-diaminopimelate desuccinylase [Solirubrobacteraceae bacterium]|nr:succinyl-diaminopimelate desuccinylase [Solirubrobacteraceae bacterium]